MVEKALGWIRQLTELGLAIIALGVVLQIIFGSGSSFSRIGYRRSSSCACETIRKRRISRTRISMGTMGNLL